MDRKRKASSELVNDREQPPPANSMSPTFEMNPQQLSPVEASSPTSQKSVSSVHTDDTNMELCTMEMLPDMYESYLRMYALSVNAEQGYLPSSPNLCALTSAQATLSRLHFACDCDQPIFHMANPGFAPSTPEVDSRLGIGFCIGRCPPWDDAAYVDLIVVNRPYRGQGHARRIYREFFKRCIALKRYNVIALMKKADSSSQNFHRALGFEEGTLDDESGYDEKQLVAMRMELPVLPNGTDYSEIKRLFPMTKSQGGQAAKHTSEWDPSP